MISVGNTLIYKNMNERELAREIFFFESEDQTIAHFVRHSVLFCCLQV